jgi:8-oxo-dGTP diphosphatase
VGAKIISDHSLNTLTRVALAIIEKNGNVLICKRKKNGPFADKWEFPGGKIEDNETPEECLKRELSEEIGIKTRVRKFLCLGTHDYSHMSVELMVYLVDIQSGVIQLHEHEDIKWVSPSELPQYDLPEGNTFIIKKVMRELF